MSWEIVAVLIPAIISLTALIIKFAPQKKGAVQVVEGIAERVEIAFEKHGKNLETHGKNLEKVFDKHIEKLDSIKDNIKTVSDETRISNRIHDDNKETLEKLQGNFTGLQAKYEAIKSL